MKVKLRAGSDRRELVRKFNREKEATSQNRLRDFNRLRERARSCLGTYSPPHAMLTVNAKVILSMANVAIEALLTQEDKLSMAFGKKDMTEIIKEK